jgi:hypothetical protein
MLNSADVDTSDKRAHIIAHGGVYVRTENVQVPNLPATESSKKADVIFSRGSPGEIADGMAVAIKDTCERQYSVRPDDIELCAGVVGEVYVVYHDEGFVEVFDVVSDVVEVIWRGDSVGVVGFAGSAGVSGLGYVGGK